MTDTNEFLQERYNNAMTLASGQTVPRTSLSPDIATCLNVIINQSENSKAVLTVVLTSAVYKILNPEQDIRLHQSSIPNGYSGRTFDTTYITPFLKSCRFPAMAESGWLTRSLEQKVPYNFNYTGAISPAKLKTAFLNAIDSIENSGQASDILDYLLQKLIIQRDSKVILIAKPLNLPISSIISLLNNHFHARYKAKGASRLPVLAIYAIYQSLFQEGMKRFEGKVLCPLESHTSADARSGRIGDIDIVNSDNTPFEAVEVKFDIPVSHDIVVTAREKIQPTNVSRYYILSSAEILPQDKDKIEEDIIKIKNTHGCQLIVNGILSTLKYYLRLLDNTSLFIENYTTLLAEDNTVKFEHKQKWNDLVSTI